MNVLLLRLQEHANHYAREELRAIVAGSRFLSSQSQDATLSVNVNLGDDANAEFLAQLNDKAA